jgi:hypothetical protein
MSPYYLMTLLLTGLFILPAAHAALTETDGYLSVISSPSEATVIFDGSETGTTPVIVTIGESSLPPHTIILKKSGYLDWDTSIDQNPEPGTAETVSATLTPVIAGGSISVSSTPEDASVALDGADSRKTPYSYLDVSPGDHDIAITKDGYVPYTTTITVSSGAESVVFAAISRDPGSRTGGSIIVTSDPLGATVTLDGAHPQKTPYTYADVQAGTHSLEIGKEGFSQYVKTITVEAGTESVVSAVLSQVTRTASLTVTSNPSGAEIYLNDVYYGVTPASFDGISPGIYTVKAEKSWCKTERKIISLTAGDDSAIQFTLIPKRGEGPFYFLPGDEQDLPPWDDIPVDIGPGGPPGIPR